MQELETLLNTLIKMGRKPFGIEVHAEYIDRIVIEGTTMHIIFKGDGEYIGGLRTLVSQESGLWQFVCDNKMVYSSSFIEWQKWGEQGATLGLLSMFHKYRLLESALIPEEELAQFLLDNIKVE